MKALRTGTSAVILLVFITLGGCASFPGPESSITGFQNTSSFGATKVFVSFPVVAEKDMSIRKTPDATEKEVANEVYVTLRGNLAHRNLLSSDQNSDVLNIELKVHYIDEYFGAYKYFGVVSNRGVGGQIILARAIIKKNMGMAIAQIDSLHNTASYIDRKPMVGEISLELANQIEKILKEGVAVGKSP